MKQKLLSTSLVLAACLAATSLAAEQTTAKIEDHYRYVDRRVPVTDTVCRMQEVPVYQDVEVRGNGNAAGGALLGMIIGGAAGKAITGKDNGAAAGAVMGGIIGADRGQRNSTHIERRIVGYRDEQVCEQVTSYTTSRERIYDYSTIEWKLNGVKYRHRFTK